MALEHETPHARGKRMLRESGYHPDEAQDAALIHKMVKPKALKRRNGGHVEGKEPEGRPDKRARGGRTVVNVIAGHGGENPQAAQQAHQMGVQQGMRAGAQLGARAAAQKLAGAAHPGMGVPPPMGAPPPGIAPSGPGGPPMVKRGGGIKARAKGGAVDDGSGEPPMNLRAEKFSGNDEQHMPPFPKQDQPIKVREHVRRRSGGAMNCD